MREKGKSEPKQRNKRKTVEVATILSKKMLAKITEKRKGKEKRGVVDRGLTPAPGAACLPYPTPGARLCVTSRTHNPLNPNETDTIASKNAAGKP